MVFLEFTDILPRIHIVLITHNAVLFGHGKVELSDGRFFNTGNKSGEFGVQCMNPAESQRFWIVGFTNRDLFPGFHVSPSAELVSLLIEEEVALGDAVAYGQRGIRVLLNMGLNQFC